MSNVPRRQHASSPPNKVLEIKPDALEIRQVKHRLDGMVLYDSSWNGTESVYEIVLHRSYSESKNTSYSLYRAATLIYAEDVYSSFVQSLPLFVTIATDMYTINGLQKICDILIQNPSWSIAHLVVNFNLIKLVHNLKVLSFIDYPDHKILMTPFQLAIKLSNLEMVKKLAPMCNMEHLDYKSNSIYHYAATSSIKIINILLAKTTVNLNHFNLEGYTPLHLACSSNNTNCVKALMQAGARVNITARDTCYSDRKSSTAGYDANLLQFDTNKLFIQDMKDGGTPLHWSSSREVLVELINRGCDINAVNFEEKTALHVMIERNRLECVVTLLSHEAEIDLRDKNGNTALHLAIQNKLMPMVQCLVVFGCDFDIENEQENSPRHMVSKYASGTNESMILYILHSVGAKRCPPNKKNCSNGCSAVGTYNGTPPKQPESPEQREEIQQVLATTSKTCSNTINSPSTSNSSMADVPSSTMFDGRPEQKSKNVLDEILQMFSYFIIKEGQLNKGTLSSMETNSSRGKKSDIKPIPNTKGGRLLCLDGGGVRGLLLVQMLLEIEQLTRTPIHHLFDWIAGTSAGGILALGIGCGKTMRECMCLYLRMKDEVFIGSRPYPSSNLEALLKEILGEFTCMADIKHPKIMVTGVLADREPVELHLFRNYSSASDILRVVTPTSQDRVLPPPPEEQLLWRAARATSAAPSYFGRAFGQFLDGGLIANNPTLDAMTEIHEYNMALRNVGRQSDAIPLSVVVSLGTGLIPIKKLNDIDLFIPGLINALKFVNAASTVVKLLVDQATASDGRVVDRARAWCSMIGVPYFRFNPQMSADIALNEKDNLKLINLLWETKAYLYANRNKVIEMVTLINQQ